MFNDMDGYDFYLHCSGCSVTVSILQDVIRDRTWVGILWKNNKFQPSFTNNIHSITENILQVLPVVVSPKD